MARKRSPERDIAKEIYLESKGTIMIKDIAKQVGKTPAQISKWKSLDKWEEELKKNKRGAPKGNKNAVGAGAPKGNKNAETHGGYSEIKVDELPKEELEYLNSITLCPEENMLKELRLLIAKERDIRRRMDEIDLQADDYMYLSREVEMHALLTLDELEGLDPEEVKERMKDLQPKMKTIVKENKFERYIKLQAAYDRLHGRIIKLLDSIKSYEMDQKKLDLEERKYNFAKQRITGEYYIDPLTGDIIDDTGDQEDDDLE